VLPFGIRGGDVEQASALLGCQRSADRPLMLRQVLDVISERPPSAAELQHPRQHADIHIDRAIRDAGVVTGALEVGDRRRRDRGERDVAKVLLDDAEPLSSSSIVLGEHRIRLAVRYASTASDSRFGPCSSVGSRPCPASSIVSRSRRMATRRFVVPRRLR
jgi:hypothetical protein